MAAIAIPIAGTIVGLAAAPVYRFISTWWDVNVAPHLEPQQLDTRYRAFSSRPIVLPSVDMLIGLYISNTVDPQTLMDMMRDHGVEFGRRKSVQWGIASSELSMRQRVWNAIAKSRLYVPGVEFLASMYLSGKTLNDDKQTNAALLGMRLLGVFDRDAVDESPPWWNQLLYRSSMLITPHEMWQLYWKGLALEEHLISYYKNHAFSGDEFNWNFMKKFNAWVPGPSDMIRFIVREAFTPDVVRKYGYDEEYPGDYERLFRLSGVHYPIRELLGPPQKGEKDVLADVDTWTKAYWRAHWDLPSPTQGYEMLHRLRPGGAQRLAAQLGVDANSIVTDIEDIRTLLKVADYPRFWRDRLIAISYRPMTRNDIVAVLQEGIQDPVPAVERLQDIGYSRQDAEVIARLYAFRSVLRLANRGFFISPRIAIRMYANNEITLQELEGVARTLNLPDNVRNAMIHTAELQARIYQRRALVREVLRARVRNVITEMQMRQRLQQLALDQAQIDRLVQLAEAKRLGAARRDTAQGTIWDWQRGLITTADAIVRLEELGFLRQDAIRLLRRGYIKEVERRIRLLQAQYRALEAEMRRLLALQEKKMREARQLAKERNIALEKALEEVERRYREARSQAERERKEREKQAQEQVQKPEEQNGQQG